MTDHKTFDGVYISREMLDKFSFNKVKVQAIRVYIYLLLHVTEECGVIDNITFNQVVEDLNSTENIVHL